MVTMAVDTTTVRFHRNGVSGLPFHSVKFEWRDPIEEEWVSLSAFVFEKEGAIVVFREPIYSGGVVVFKPDEFEGALRGVIAAWEEDRASATDLRRS